MNIRTTTAFAAGAVVALVLGTGTAYAANGGHFVLGGNNYESREASLNNSAGTALTLRSKSGTPSLKVNQTTKVPSLNADLLDGVNSSSLVRTTTQLGTITAPGFLYDNQTPGDPSDDLIVAVAECPTGSQVMGGGADDASEDGLLISSFPDFDPDTETDLWVAISSATPTQVNADAVTAFARCWKPSGSVADNFARKAPSELSPSAKRLIGGATRDNK